jgi:Bardet-Biedl syndrome 7 protein
VRVWTVGEYVHTRFDNGKDVATYVCPDRIHAQAVDRVTRDFTAGEPDVLLGCADRLVRVIRGDACIMQAGADAAVTALCVVPLPLGPGGAYRYIVYGTAGGTLGLMLGNASGLYPSWAAQPVTGAAAGAQGAAINCIVVTRLSSAATLDVVVGRDDGVLELYVLDLHTAGTATPATPDAPSLPPYLVASVSLAESIRSVAVGTTMTPGQQEVLVQTFSGRLMAFTVQSAGEDGLSSVAARAHAAAQSEAQVGAVAKEIEELKKAVRARRRG